MTKSPLLFYVLLSCLLNSTAGFAQTISLNGPWAFRTDPNIQGETRGWFNANHPTAGWDSLPVPGNWDLRNEYAHYVGKGWYRRTFATPARANGKTVRLVFEAVYHDCTVWLNGRKLGENHSGFLPFEFDVTGLLNADRPNTLVVCADNSLTRGAIWNWGGIRRPVTLESSETVSVVRQHVTPTVDLAAKTATVAVRVFVQNYQNQPAEVTGTVQLSAINGFARSLPFRISLPASATASVVVQTRLTPAETHLWHFDDPFLYTAESALTELPVMQPVRRSDSDRTGSGRTNRFGLRKIEVDNKAYTLKLNGEVIRPMGFNLVPDDRTTGNTLPTWRIKEDIDLLKGLGCTMTRLSHLCLPDEVLDYLDERGMLVISEIPLWGFDRLADPASATSRDWLTRLITNQYNHPSVIGWSVGNEYGDYPTAVDYTKQAVAYARTLDSTRLVSCVSHTAQNPTDIIDLGDIGLINKYGQNLAPITRRQHELHPGKTLFYTEYGIGQLVENLDGDLNARLLIDSLRNLPYLIGGSLWTFNDYRSRFHGTKEFSENRPWGVVDVYRQKKRAYHSVRRELNPVRSMTVQPQSATSATVDLQPRGRLDLPAYPLQGYQLLWKRTDATGKIGQSGLISLPVIRPGDARQTHSLRWQSDNAFALTVELLAPTGDVLADTTLFGQKPAPVRVTYAVGGRANSNGVGAGGTIHVLFSKNPTATAYKARYGLIGGPSQETPPTSNDYIDIPNVEFGKTYQVAVFGINNAGLSELGDGQEVLVEKLSFAPPVIQHVEPADGGFFVGYASQGDDSQYRIQVAAKPDATRAIDWSTARTLQTTNPGGLYVPDLINGQPYHFRFQRVRDNWSDSNWSAERVVTPDGGQRSAAPVLQGVVWQTADSGSGRTNESLAVICFEPVAKATGYVLEYRQANGSRSGVWQRRQLATAQVGRFSLTGLAAKEPYQFRLAALNSAGQSEFSPVITTQRYAEGQRHR